MNRNMYWLRWYFGLAYAFSWTLGIPLALQQHGIIAPILPMWTHYLIAYSPMLAALLVTWRSRGMAGLRSLLGRVVLWRVGVRWCLVALSPLIIGTMVVLGFNFVTGQTIMLADLGKVNFLPPLGFGALGLWLITFGLGEEIGWRGYALPILQQQSTALGATLRLTLWWAGWHVPQFFYVLDPKFALGWLIGLFAGAIVFTWLLNSSRGSLLMTIIFHGCFNFMSASDAGNGIVAAVVSTIVMLGAIVIVLKFRSQHLAGTPRFVGIPSTI